MLSKDNKSHDLVLKRHDYAKAGIPQHWIVDPDARILTVPGNVTGGTYREVGEVTAGQLWNSDLPFPLRLDPAEFC